MLLACLHSFILTKYGTIYFLPTGNAIKGADQGADESFVGCFIDMEEPNRVMEAKITDFVGMTTEVSKTSQPTNCMPWFLLLRNHKISSRYSTIRGSYGDGCACHRSPRSREPRIVECLLEILLWFRSRFRIYMYLECSTVCPRDRVVHTSQ